MSADARRALPGWLDAAAVAGIAGFALGAAARAAHLQWDFRTYLFAARAALAGLDPYAAASLDAIAGRPVLLPWLYPPVALVPFLPLAALSPATAAALWLALRLALLAAIVVLWRRTFLPRAPWCAVALVAVFGSDAAAVIDLRAGNLGIVEAALLAAAGAAWVRGRMRVYAACVVAAATFKLVPILHLVALLVPAPGRRARPALALGAAALFAALVAGPRLVGWPAWAGGFLAHVPAGFPVGTANPTLYALFETFLRPRVTLDALRALWVTAAWGGVALLVLAASARALARTARERGGRDLPVALALLEALLSPRLMQYGFVRAGLPLLRFAPEGRADGTGILPWAVLVALPGLLRCAGYPFTNGTWSCFLPLLAVAAAWATWVAGRVRE